MENKPQSVFSNVPSVKQNEIFENLKNFSCDPNPNKINLGIGMFLDEDNKLIEFESVIKAELMIHNEYLNKEYTQIGGGDEFTKTIMKILFSNEYEDLDFVKENRYLVVQAATGGSALHLSSDVIQLLNKSKIHLSKETWGLYKNIYSNLEILHYPYLTDNKIEIESIVKYLNTIDNGSAINLQLSSHNPLGLDMTKEEWDTIAEVMRSKQHLAVFDIAYLGYGSGNIKEDMYPVYKFAERKVEMLLTYSSAKNFASYSDDVGAIVFIINKPEPIPKIRSNMIVLSRSLFSFPTIYGPRIMQRIIESPELYSIWVNDQEKVIKRIQEIRAKLVESLEKEKVKVDLDFIKRQRGIYMYLNLTDEQVKLMIKDYSIYLSQGGRVNLSALNNKSMKYFVTALKNLLD